MRTTLRDKPHVACLAGGLLDVVANAHFGVVEPHAIGTHQSDIARPRHGGDLLLQLSPLILRRLGKP